MTIATSGRRSVIGWGRISVFVIGLLLSATFVFGLAGTIAERVDADPAVDALILLLATLWIATWQGTRRQFPPLPYRRGQVPRRLSKTFPGVLMFGAALGLGLATKVTTGLVHVALLMVVLLGDTRIGILAGIAFAVGRGVPLVLAALLPMYPKDPAAYMSFLSGTWSLERRTAVNTALIGCSGLTTSMLLLLWVA